MANHCQKHFLLPGGVIRALLHPTIDPGLRLDRPQCKIHLVQCRHHSLSRARGSWLKDCC